MIDMKHSMRVILNDDELKFIERIGKRYANEMRELGIMPESYKRDGTVDTNTVGTIRFALWKVAQGIETNTAD